MKFATRLAVGDGERALAADQAVEPVGVERPRARPLPHGIAGLVVGGDEPWCARLPDALVAHGERAVGAEMLERDPMPAPPRHDERCAVAGLDDVDGVGADMPRAECDRAGRRVERP